MGLYYSHNKEQLFLWISKRYFSFLSSIQPNSEIVPRLDYNRFLPNPFPFIVHQSSYHSTLYGPAIDSVVKTPSPNKYDFDEIHASRGLPTQGAHTNCSRSYSEPIRSLIRILRLNDSILRACPSDVWIKSAWLEILQNLDRYRVAAIRWEMQYHS